MEHIGNDFLYFYLECLPSAILLFCAEGFHIESVFWTVLDMFMLNEKKRKDRRKVNMESKKTKQSSLYLSSNCQTFFPHCLGPLG